MKLPNPPAPAKYCVTAFVSVGSFDEANQISQRWIADADSVRIAPSPQSRAERIFEVFAEKEAEEAVIREARQRFKAASDDFRISASPLVVAVKAWWKKLTGKV